MKILLIFILLLLMGWQLWQLLRRGAWRELLVYALLMSLALFYSWGYVAGRDFPNPYDYLDLIFRPVTFFIEKSLMAL
ncbi:MAG: hypothetical protein ACOY81_11830 [Bacillota bacterium]|uniref:hypothetical protein n=1 Tax=Desulfurispora thermophila TaxID=265470 RepID=UPI000366B829|nr:hypothetical protein [Desulfurispora thermophila]